MKTVVGIDFGGTGIKAAVVDDTGKLTAEKRVPSSPANGWKDTLTRMADLVSDVVTTSGLRPSAIGIGSPGPLSIKNGVLLETPNLKGWENVPLRDFIAEKTGLPVAIENDANCAAIAEHRFGAAVGCDHALILTFGTGIGGGAIINGKILHGASDMAGELGHISMEPDGHPCGCGSVGCFETLCSATAVERRYRERTGARNGVDCSGKALVEAVERNSPDAIAVLDDVCMDMARGIGSLVNVFNPQVVVLAGGLMRGGDAFLPRVRKLFPHFCFPSAGSKVRIELTKLKDRAGIIGAASLVL